jgi:hypothetical protein
MRGRGLCCRCSGKFWSWWVSNRSRRFFISGSLPGFASTVGAMLHQYNGSIRGRIGSARQGCLVT